MPAALGYAKNTRTAFEQSSEPIPWSVFNGAWHEALVNMISVMSTKDFAILSPGRFEERLLIFEEFANGGLHILNELVARAERQSLDLVLDLIMDSEGPRESGEEPEIKKFASDLSWWESPFVGNVAGFVIHICTTDMGFIKDGMCRANATST